MGTILTRPKKSSTSEHQQNGTSSSRASVEGSRCETLKVTISVRLRSNDSDFQLVKVYTGHSLVSMKYYHLILTLTVILALPTITVAKEKGTGATADVEATIKKIEQELTDTIVKSDTSAFEKYLASDYLGIGPDGVTQNKSELLADIKSGTLKLESSNLSDMKIQVAEADMAVVVYRSDDKGTYKGKDITGQYRWLDVFVKRDGKWQIAIDQGTQIAKQ